MKSFLQLCAAAVALTLGVCGAEPGAKTPAKTPFEQAALAYRQADYPRAATLFQQSSVLRPAAGALQNLGNAEWLSGHAGPAILAWEQALWIDPRNDAARANLRFARQQAEIEEPHLAWFEICSTWVPFNTWAWLAGATLTLSITLILLPSVFRWRKADWQQALAAAAFAVFLLSLPGVAGVHTRSQLGFIQPKEAPLRLTPTREAQWVARLPSGEPARLERERGDYLFVRTRHAEGWVLRSEFAAIGQP